MMIKTIEDFSRKFLQKTPEKKIYLVSHYDTDGISSAAIISKTFKRLQKQFSLKIIKQLSEEEINLLPKNEIIFLLDLGSGNFKELSKLENEIFIIDHHETSNKKIPQNINILNPHLTEEYEDLCSSELSYLFSRCFSEENKDLSQLAILGMIGDTMERNITKTREKIIRESEIKIKKGFLIYPSTRPLDKALEYSPRPFIPGITGNARAIYDLLKEIGIEKIGKNFKALIDLNEEEMKKFVTAIMLRFPSKEKSSEYIGNLYLIKLFNKIEDAREISAIVNACSRMGMPEIALMLCLGNISARRKAERIYFKYRQHIIAGLRFIEKNEKIEGREYVIINAKDNVKDTIIGTLTSILSFSSIYKEGTIIVAMAYDNEKIKVSMRMAGRNPKSSRNLKDLIESVISSLGGISGGHKEAAGCIIERKNENKFIELIKRKLEYEMIKV